MTEIFIHIYKPEAITVYEVLAIMEYLAQFEEVLN